jgi:hypothetical protein
MIFVIDNGGKFSDHRIYFVESQYSREVMQQVCEVCSMVRGSFKIVAESEKMTWTSIRPMQTHELLDEIVYDFDDPDIIDKLKVLPQELLLQAGRPQ